MEKYLTIVKNKKNLIAAIGVSLTLLVGAVVLVTSIIGANSTSVFSIGTADTAKLTVNVVEGYTESPIVDASVVVVETGNVYTTNSEGHTGVIEVPLVRDTRYDKILAKPWGEITLIIYKEGFMPYALFYLQVVGGQTREGVKILLFEQGITDSNEPFSIIEGPNRIWVDELIKMYQPAQ